MKYLPFSVFLNIFIFSFFPSHVYMYEVVKYIKNPYMLLSKLNLAHLQTFATMYCKQYKKILKH